MISPLFLSTVLLAAATQTVDDEPLHAGKDENKQYFLLEPPGLSRSEKRDLVLLLPGGSGQAKDFLPFAKSIHGESFPEAVFAVVSAPQWSDWQKEHLIWPTRHSKGKVPEAEFTTEELIHAVREDVRKRRLFKIEHTWLYGWSSSGPALYLASMEKKVPYDGYYIRASVFRADELVLTRAKGRRFYLQQGRDDTITPLRHAEAAAAALEQHGAEVKLEVYEGTHGFDLPTDFERMRAAFAWLRGEEE